MKGCPNCGRRGRSNDLCGRCSKKNAWNDDNDGCPLSLLVFAGWVAAIVFAIGKLRRPS